jgi:Ca2+-binding RTX toxin-like protein
VDDILGTSRADVLRGTAGADVIRGLGGKDEIRGLAGNDTLYGDAGFDELFGNGGLDRLFGGANGDRFTFLSAGEAPVRGPGYDEVMDFSRTEADKINLRLIDANAGTSGVNENFAFLGTRALSGPAQVRYEATADGDFLVTGSNDADAAAEFAFIVRTDLTELRGSDFIL